MSYLIHTGTEAEAQAREISRQYWLMLSAEYPDDTSTTHLGEVIPDPKNPNRWAIHIPDQTLQLSANAIPDAVLEAVMQGETKKDKDDAKAALKADCNARKKVKCEALIPAKLKAKNRFLTREQLIADGWFVEAEKVAEEKPKDEKPVKPKKVVKG